MSIRKFFMAVRMVLVRDPEKIARLYQRSGVRMGSGCTVFPGVRFGSEPYLVELGSRVRVTAGVQFVTHDGGMHVLRQRDGMGAADVFGTIRIGNNVFIGINSIILPGVKIGDNVIVGAGSVVSKDIPANSVAAGVPARVLRTIDEYAAKMATVVEHTKGFSAESKRRYLTRKFLVAK